MLPAFIPARVGAQHRTNRSSDMSGRMLFKHTSQRGQGTAAAVFDNRILSLQLTHGSVKHLMRHGVGKEDHQIRAPKLVAQTTARFGKNLCLTLIGLDCITISAYIRLLNVCQVNGCFFDYRKLPAVQGVQKSLFLFTFSRWAFLWRTCCCMRCSPCRHHSRRSCRRRGFFLLFCHGSCCGSEDRLSARSQQSEGD